MGLVIPFQREAGGARPSEVVALNEGHPLAQDIVMFAVPEKVTPSGVGGTVRDLVTGRTFTHSAAVGSQNNNVAIGHGPYKQATIAIRCPYTLTDRINFVDVVDDDPWAMQDLRGGMSIYWGAWFDATNHTEAFGRIVDKSDSGSGNLGYSLYEDGGQWVFRHSGIANTQVSSSTGAPAESWHRFGMQHFTDNTAYAFDCRFYKDGVPGTSDTASLTALPPETSGATQVDLAISSAAATWTAQPRSFAGYIEFVAVYRSAHGQSPCIAREMARAPFQIVRPLRTFFLPAAAAPSGRIMGSIAGEGGLAGHGGLAGAGGGLAG